MVKPRLVVHHPHPATEVTGLPYTSNGTNYFFVAAFGRACGFNPVNQGLVACLLGQDGHVVARGKLLQGGMHWVIGFEELPAKKEKYHLFIGQTDAPAGVANQTATLEFTVVVHAPPVAAAPPRPFADIPVQYPPSNSTICPQFTASGSWVGGTATTGASMWRNGAKVADGTPVPVPPGLWMYSFTGIPENTGYVFQVTDSPGPDTGGSNNITVDLAACAAPGSG